MTDIKLWEDIRRGSREAVGELFQRYADVMLAYGLKIVSDREAVIDAIQSVFLQILKSDGQLGTTDNVKAYLLSSLRRTIIRARINERIVTIPFSNMTSDVAISDKYPDYVSDPSLDDKSRALRSKLLHTIDSLPAREKEVLYLRYIQDTPMQEVAEIMGISYQSVRNLTHRAVIRLRTVMNGSPE